MLWIKALHLVFVISWFAGLFYLPRIFVNLAQVSDTAARERLLLMARKLYRFMAMLVVPALVFGVILLWLQYAGPGGLKLPGWLHAKLAFVALALGYHHACGALLRKFEHGVNRHSHVWFRWFNEVPVILLLVIVVLVVVKPF